MANCNWAKLVSQGRAKDIGVSWNEDELHAIYKLKIPVEYVREGILDKESYEKVMFKGEKPLSFHTDRELKEKAEKVGAEVSDEMDRFAVIRQIEAKQAKLAEIEESKPPHVDSPIDPVVEEAPESPKTAPEEAVGDKDEQSPEDFAESLSRDALKDALKEAGVEFKGNASNEALKELLKESLKG